MPYPLLSAEPEISVSEPPITITSVSRSTRLRTNISNATPELLNRLVNLAGSDGHAIDFYWTEGTIRVGQTITLRNSTSAVIRIRNVGTAPRIEFDTGGTTYLLQPGETAQWVIGASLLFRTAQVSDIAGLEARLSSLEPNTFLGTIGVSGADFTAWPAGNRNDQVQAVSSNPGTVDGVDLTANSFYRCTANNTPENTPASWQEIAQVSTSEATDTGWQPIPFSAGWGNIPDWTPFQWRRVGNTVTVHGNVRTPGGLAAGNFPVGTLPEEIRPSGFLRFTWLVGANTQSTGTISAQGVISGRNLTGNNGVNSFNITYII